MLAHGTVGGDLPEKSMCWKTLLNITAISCSQASIESRRSLCQGAPGAAPWQGRHRAELRARLQPRTDEVLLATAWRGTCPAEEEWESWGLWGDCLDYKSAGQQEVLWRIAQKDIVSYF